MLVNQIFDCLKLLVARGWKPYINRKGEIRIKSPSGICNCPITAVCSSKRHVRYEVADVASAAYQLGIRERDWDTIADAADNRRGSLSRPRTRRRLLNALGLKE